MPVRVVTPAQRLPAVIETTIYFVCSEALANAAKHAKATALDVRVKIRDEVVTLLIADDGAGGADLRAGSGLSGVRDRIEAIGGWLQIESPAGAGTHLLAQIPNTAP